MERMTAREKNGGKEVKKNSMKEGLRKEGW